MQTPLELTCHQLPHSAALEETVRHGARDLERIFDRIVSCHVLVAASLLHSEGGQSIQVRIELGIPGHRLVISEASDKPDVRLIVREAFRIARARLEQHVARCRDDQRAS